MLPHVFQPPQIIQPFDGTPHDSRFTARSGIPKSTRIQFLPYRASQSQLQPPALVQSQFAYPSHQPQSPQTSEAQKDGSQHQNSSEHMLRRKTPNGTLAAGYDGTPVQWATKPPPSKHILLPASRAATMTEKATNTTYRGTPPTNQVLHTMGHYNESKGHITPSAPLQGLPNIRNSGFADFTRLPSLLDGSNLFDRIPMHEASTYLLYDGDVRKVPTVLQPPNQPCPGPTASNDQGFYGPYWPDGRFVPYRPAAVRELGYPAFTHFNGSVHLLESAPYHRLSAYQYPASSPNPTLGRFANIENQERMLAAAGRDCMPLRHDPHASFISEPGNLQSPSPERFHSTSFHPTGKSQTAQFKEKALSWAHTVYVDLLAFLHRSKNVNQPSKRSQGLGRSYSQGNIYPKPPRQPASNYSSRHHSTVDVSDHKIPSDRLPESSQISGVRRGSYTLTSHLEYKYSEGGPRINQKPHVSNAYLGPERRNSASLLSNSERDNAVNSAKAALEMLTNLCQESEWRWIDGMLLGGCLAYGLEDYQNALDWYSKIVSIDQSHVEAISNLAATLLSLNRRAEAEQHWLQSVKLRPSYFEAVEHLVGLLCGDHRGNEAVSIIEYVERSLRITPRERFDHDRNENSSDKGQSSCESTYVSSESTLDFERDLNMKRSSPSTDEDYVRLPGFGSSGYAIPGSDNGRMLALVHAKGNMLYALGDGAGASKAFEDAVLIGAGRRTHGVRGLIQKILHVLSPSDNGNQAEGKAGLVLPSKSDPLLLPPDKALRTAKLVFPKNGDLPGLRFVGEGMAKNAAISTTSNSLLSLAKIFQDGMSSAQQLIISKQLPSSVGDILALYYLSLSLQPSPSTANNVGILLASVPQPISLDAEPRLGNTTTLPAIPGVVPGSGVALALAYYNYGLNLDARHAHLFTNLGSLLKDIGQLTAAIKMYEQAVACDSTFDIALANLANAVKDQGRISDAIEYYKRAVAASPDFAEAVCGLANALNSVCDWTGRGGVLLGGGKYDRWHVNENGMLCDAEAGQSSAGWMKRVIDIVGKQLEDGANWGRGILQDHVLESILRQVELADSGDRWPSEKSHNMQARLRSWAGKVWEGARVVHLVERAMKRAMHRWYRDKFIYKKNYPHSAYSRPPLPNVLSIPGAPTVLPFHTFTCPLSAKDIRMISQRNALRISCSTLRQPWLPASVYEPPSPPNPHLNIGYVSSDFNNHPLAHLMQSVFGLHDVSKAKAFCYATTASDHSIHREQIEREAPMFRDASSWPSDRLVQQIVDDEIHILVNLNGYTRGARNEVFAARPAPIQMSFMGFAGTLGAEWCDYLLADEIAIPAETLRPWRRNVELEDQFYDEESVHEEDWVYSENIIFCRDTFFCCDHRQSSPDAQLPWAEEQQRRWRMRKELFPNLSDGATILGNFNQLYKIEPTTFRTWLRILAKVPKAILWLLRFPDLGESNLKRTARQWAGEEVASRIWFTDVAPKSQHISRARVCDLFLDTPECNAHTTAADVLWSSTPLLTLPRYKYKMCSRMAASILTGALPKTTAGIEASKELIAEDEGQYEEFAVKLANGLSYDREGRGSGRLIELRKLLYESRSTSALFDTKRWVSDLELAYQEAWRRWVEGIGGDIYL